MAEQNQFRLNSKATQHSKESAGYSESVMSEYTAQTSFCSDQEITSRQSITLTESNFSEIYDVLSEVRDKWFNIGLQLGITIVTLKDIERKYPESLDALREVLIICSSQRRTELKDIIEALCKPTVDQQVCARMLEELARKLQHNEESSAVTVSGHHSSDVKSKENHPFVRKLTRRDAQKAKCTHHFDVVVVGDPTVGKTTTVNNYYKVYLDFETGRSTVAAIKHDARIFKYKDQYVQLVLWDMPGDDDCFDKVEQSCFESTDGAILMFDVTNKQSLINLVSDEDNSRKIKRSWMKELMFKAIGNKHPVMVLVGNKIDAKRRQIQESDVELLLKSQELEMPYFEISAKEDLNVEDVFTSIIEMLINKATEDKRYGKQKANHNNDSRILASSLTHSFEEAASGGGRRTRSLPLYRSAHAIPQVPVASRQEPHALTSKSKGSHHPQQSNTSCCVLL